jgi:hypothetical protein
LGALGLSNHGHGKLRGFNPENAMSNHVFHPPVELADHAIAYAQGLVDHAGDYGPVPMNSPSELAPIISMATPLVPKAKEIHDLELKLAALRESYNAQALPLWAAFSDKLAHARVYAEHGGRNALLNFLRTYQHHGARHAAAKSAGVVPPAK